MTGNEIPHDPWMAACDIEEQTPVTAGTPYMTFPVSDHLQFFQYTPSGSMEPCTVGNNKYWEPPLTLDSYQEKARSTAVYPEEAAVVYPVLGLVGEAGEVAEKVLMALFPDGPIKTIGPIENRLNDVYFALKHAAEAGAECEKVKKVVRDKQGTLPAGFLAALKARVDSSIGADDSAAYDLIQEAADVLWYEASIAHDIGGEKLSNMAQYNLDKLASRMERGKIGGSGDQR